MKPITIWRLVDGKAGHESQTRGLADALARLCPAECHDVPVPPPLRAVAMWMSARFPPGANLPDPELILAAGHRTHFAALAAQRARSGRTVVLMKPTLPCRWFDLCLIPRHDGVEEAGNVVLTTGALNPVRPARDADARRGLILVGGPSSHHGWDENAMLDQVGRVVASAPDVDWTLTTSRRTPPGTTKALQALPLDNLEVVLQERTEPGWVAARLRECATVWVTEDSISMVFEALTAGARVGLLATPLLNPGSRVRRAVDEVVRSGLAVALPSGGQVPAPPSQTEPLAEAERCARLVLERFMKCP